ncbi:CPA1 family monovalent cation:H+ antiporter [Amycolatopsis bartoniae]|uniref:Na+/H+ antiporter n=1 Tax=Amycolatopsis bartoniae TaxID=941986 RepID=A0A8H9M955_9PSEU|nr:Na+/H+ antiporter [Amycolatopsis bartoniae]MBB2939511.1 CPA1 family monovalent cation:H+ antiporter [Amycolatopsis bartoniae]TVT00327.1 Na+/H+ antiporter [Amycolatopsis bartoniae]GHF38828.1 Na+/H+ antiporter [Amycolatopsis bartoniae]
MHLAIQIVGLVVAVLTVTGIARRFDWSPPLCLIVFGVAASFVPGMPDYHLDPELVLVGLLPPLLYASALTTSLVEIRANRTPIGLLSVGLVVFTTFAVGLATWLVIPGLPLAAGLALGAVVAPPDAVAASAVARRVGMPRQVVRILEGESLLNDAAALVALRTAIAAIAGSVAMWQVGLDFLLAAVGGLVVGLLVGWLAVQLRRRLLDPVFDTAWSFVVPFVAYLAAEALHGSGVLAVVVAGLVLGQQMPRTLPGPARLASRINWRTIQFLLENVVFLLIGLQLRRIIGEVADSRLSAWAILGVCACVLLVTILSRIVWVFATALARRLLPAWDLPWSYSAAIGWAGMRGVVTLAAAFVLPADTPERGVLVLAAFVVVAGTLMLQGTTLPRLVRRLDLPAPDPGEDALQQAALLHDMTQAGLARLQEVRTPDDPADVIARLEDKQTYRSDSAWERLGYGSNLRETPSAAYRRLRAEMLTAEREVLLTARDRGTVDDEVLRRVLDTLDIEESMLEPQDDAARADGLELRTPASTAGSCDHLTHPGDATSDAEGCEDCLREGTTWVHLRLCLECGHVGCCDSSPRRHASKHYHDTEHPVIRSYEPGEDWRWCFVDRVVG